MITDSGRREVAQKLRAMVSARSYEMPGGRGSPVDIDDLLTELLGRRVYDSEESVDSFEAMYVADLIDPPIATRICEKCGGEWPSDIVFERCPYCGTVVDAMTTEELNKITSDLRYTAADTLGSESFQRALARITKAPATDWRTVMRHIADLIGRGVCYNVYDESECGACDNGFECSVCGCKVEDEEHYHVSGTWNFCPQCGKRVWTKNE